MSGITNRGKYLVLDRVMRNAAAPTNLYVALCDASIAPTDAMATLSQLAQIPTGDGYASGGFQLNRNATDFPTLTEDDGSNLAVLYLKDIDFLAAGGYLPPSGTGARWAVLTTDEGTVANRQIIAFWDLGGNRVASDTQDLILHLEGLRLKLPSGWTNRGLKMLLDIYFRAAAAPTVFYAALCDSSLAPSATTNILSDLAQVPAGSGYTNGGFSLARNNTDFPTLTQDDGNHRTDISTKPIVWTASGGSIPSSGTARYVALTDDNGTVNNRQVLAYGDLTANRNVSDTQLFTITALSLRFKE